MLLAAFLVACGGSEAEPTAAPQATAAVQPTSEPTPTLAQPATLPPPVISGGEGTQTGGDVAPAATPTPAMLPAWPANQFGYGVQSHALVGDPAYAMDVVKNQLKMDWVKVQFEWRLVHSSPTDRQWFFYDGVVDEAHKKGVYLMLSVVSAPPWTRSANNEIGPPDDYAVYADFLKELVTRYKGKVHAIEVWNEQNLDREWQTANGVSPEDYVQFLSQAYQAIKEVDPNVIVISGALSPTGPGDWVKWADDFEWLDRALAAGMLTHADCVGVHHNGYNLPPNIAFDQTGTIPEAQTAGFRGPFDNPHHSWSFKTTLDTYAQKVQAVDPNKKLCVTEFGWASTEGYDTFPTGFEFALDNTLEEQATYLVQAFDQMRESGDVWIAYVFNFDFGNKGSGPTDDPVPYSIIDTNGVPRPAFSALANMEKKR